MLGTPADAAIVLPAARVVGRIRVPGDKSISHRYVMLAALADGSSTIYGYSSGADCAATLACLAGLGVPIRRSADQMTIEGRGLRGLAEPAAPLDAANSGTTMRLLSGIVAAHEFRTVIAGDASLTRRPMRRVIDPLTRMGATITSNDGRPPLAIDGGRLHGISYSTAVPSAQVKSAVLLAGLQADDVTTVIEPTPTRDHTERALQRFGVEVRASGNAITIQSGQRLTPANLTIPGDISSATFWIVLAAATPGGSVDIDDVGLNPTRTAILDIVQRAGASVDVHVQDESSPEPVGRVHVSHGELRSFAIDPHEVAGVIDEIPALAALGARLPAGASMEVRGAAELRVKESDRIHCLAQGLRSLGSVVDEFGDGFIVRARPLTGGTVDAAGDHRIAMAMAIAASGASEPSTIVGASAVSVSYPGFFEELARLTSTGGGR
jgi:3-phosphoshikimate 1-carboxyvinyltransferase